MIRPVVGGGGATCPKQQKKRVIHQDTRRTTKGHEVGRICVNGLHRHETDYQHRCTGCTGFFRKRPAWHPEPFADAHRIIARAGFRCQNLSSCLSCASCASMFIKTVDSPARLPFDPSGREGQTVPVYGAGGTPALPGGLSPTTGSHQGDEIAGVFQGRL